MRLSLLQRYVLLACIQPRKRLVPRREFLRFYDAARKRSPVIDQQHSVTKSIERLIDRGLLVGFGRRTSEKWYIDEVRVTPRGRDVARRLLGEQQRLPLRLKKATSGTIRLTH